MSTDNANTEPPPDFELLLDEDDYHVTYWGHRYSKGYRTEFGDMNEYELLMVRGFCRRRGIDCAISDIDTKDGYEAYVAIPKSEILWEAIATAIRGKEAILRSKQWITGRELASHQLPRRYTIHRPVNSTAIHEPILHCKHTKGKNGDNVNCKCSINEFRQPVRAKIVDVNPNKYYGELEPEYEVDPVSSTKINKGWCNDHQLTNIDAQKYPYKSWGVGLGDLVIANIRKYIKHGCYGYYGENLINPDDLPLDCKIRSSYFGKVEQYEEDKYVINEVVNDDDHKVYVDAAKKLIKKLINAEIDGITAVSIGEHSVLRTKLTKRAGKLNGLFIDEKFMELGLLKICNDIGIHCNFETNYISLNLEEGHLSYFNKERCLKKYPDRAECHLSSTNPNIFIKYSRKWDYLLICNMEYETKNYAMIRHERRNSR